MAKPKPWSDRVNELKGEVERSSKDYYVRHEIEDLFEIKRSAASELMESAGAERRGDQLRLSRAKLLDYLKYSPEGQAAQTELLRRRKFAKWLVEQKTTEWVRRRQIELDLQRKAGPGDYVVVAKGLDAKKIMQADLWSLPPGIEITRYRTTLDYPDGFNEFVAQVHAIAACLVNDMESVASRLDSGNFQHL